MPKKDSSELVIRLPDDCMEKPHKTDLAIVAGYMMWPDDKARREKFIDSSFVELAPPEMHEELFQLAKRSLPLSDVADERELATILAHGTLAGSVLFHQIAFKSHGHKISKKKIIEVLCGALDRAGNSDGVVRIHPQHFHNKVWPVFGPVAHLWASRPDRAIGRDFPCSVTHLPLLLQDAEGFRVQGEQKGFLDATRSFKFPADLEIEPAEIAAVGNIDPSPFL